MRKEQIRKEVAARMLAYSARAHYRVRRRVIEERKTEDHQVARDDERLYKLGIGGERERKKDPEATTKKNIPLDRDIETQQSKHERHKHGTKKKDGRKN